MPLLLVATGAQADTLRIATFNADLERDGPGLLLRDILRGKDPQVAAVVAIIAQTNPDILLLTSFDYDYEGRALAALQDRLTEAGAPYPHRFALRPNTGMPTGLDMDGDGRLGDARDAQSYGKFSGQGGMALLSRFPIDAGAVQDFSAILWRDAPTPLLPEVDGAPFPSEAALAVQRLSTTGHWVVPVQVTPEKKIDLLAFYATPPVFDGDEDRNGKRNHDEIMLWLHLLDGKIGVAPKGAFVVLGDANLDPVDGDGRKSAIRALLADPRLQDPKPTSEGAALAADVEHKGPPALDTVDWPDGRPGNARVDYVLPSSDLDVINAGTYWPSAAQISGGLPDPTHGSRHRLVWVDLRF